MTREEAKTEIMQIYGSLSEEKKMALDVLMAQNCDQCEVGNPCLYCEYEFKAQADGEKSFKMRDATPEERESIAKYIKSISKPTAIEFDEEQEQLDFVQPHKEPRQDLQQAAERIIKQQNKWFEEQERKEQEPAYCDHNICLRNEYNGIGCEECEVIKSQNPITKITRKYCVQDESGYTDEELVNKINEIIDLINNYKIKTLQEPYDFARWVASEIFDDMWEYNKDSFAEIACRKLAKLGIFNPCNACKNKSEYKPQKRSDKE